MLALWYADRASAVLAYVVLVASAFTGIAYNAASFGSLHLWSRRIHTPVSWVAVVLLLLHGLLGTVDTVLAATGASPAPGYGTPFLIAGVALGGGALVLTIVATLAFVDPKRFERPWKPGLVHAFAYGGFAFATIHAAGVGTDIRDFAVQGIAAIGFLLAMAVIFRRRKGSSSIGPPQLAGSSESKAKTARAPRQAPSPLQTPSRHSTMLQAANRSPPPSQEFDSATKAPPRAGNGSNAPRQPN